MRAALLLLCVTAVLSGQEKAPDQWTGTIHGPDGSPVPNASVELRSGALTNSATSSSTGNFQFSAIPAGSYRLSIKHDGREFTYPRSLQLPLDGISKLILSNDGSVTMAAPAATVSSGGQTLSADAVAAIPLNKRDFGQLLLLAAGTMTDTNGASNFTQQFAVNGQRGVEAVFALDGADSRRPRDGRRHTN